MSVGTNFRSSSERLNRFATQLVVARSRQLAVERLWLGAVLGAGVATVAVLQIRLQQMELSAALVAIVCTVLGAGIAVLVSLVRRPDALSLVIETDLRLRLKIGRAHV